MSSGPHFCDLAGDGEFLIARVVRVFHDDTARTSTVFLDDGRSFDVALEAPELEDLETGSIVDELKHAELQIAVGRKEAARFIFRWLNRRAYATGRLRERLLEKGFAVASVDGVLASFVEHGLLDDAEFARMYIRDQLRSRPVGPMWLRNALRKQGVPRAQSDVAVAELLTPERELAEARRAADRKGTGVDRAKLQRFLSSRGFRVGIAASVAREFSSVRVDEAGAIDGS